MEKNNTKQRTEHQDNPSVFCVEITHPKYGEQHNHKKTLPELLLWASYMVEFHEVNNLRFFEEQGKERRAIFPNIPKWK